MSASPESQRGIGTKQQDSLENTKSPSIHISYNQVLQNRQDSCYTGRRARKLQCIKIVYMCGNVGTLVLLSIDLCVF